MKIIHILHCLEYPRTHRGPAGPGFYFSEKSFFCIVLGWPLIFMGSRGGNGRRLWTAGQDREWEMIMDRGAGH